MTTSTSKRSGNRTAILFLMVLSSPSVSAFTLVDQRQRQSPLPLQRRSRIPVAKKAHQSFGSIGTLLHYRQGDEDQESLLLGNKLVNLWKTVFPPSPSVLDEQQRKVDQYLEFLDKRYHRIHNPEPSLPVKQRQHFSAWEWLMKDSKGQQDQVSNQQQQLQQGNSQNENALYVLGVAGLASQQLLQKHSLVSASSPASKIVDTTAYPVAAQGLFGQSVFMDRVRRKQSELVRFRSVLQKRLVQSIAKIILKVPEGPPHFLRSARRMRGRKTPVALSAAALSAMLVIMVLSSTNV